MSPPPSEPKPGKSEFYGLLTSCGVAFFINYFLICYAAHLGVQEFLVPILYFSIPALILITITCFVIKRLLAKHIKDKSEHCRIIWLVGCGLISILGYIPQVLWFFVESYKSKIFLNGLFICNYGACLIYTFFLFITHVDYRIRTKRWKERLIIYIIHFAYVGLAYLVIQFLTKKDPEYVRFTWVFQLTYVVLFSSSTADFWVILRQGVRRKVYKKKAPPPRVPAICTVAISTESQCHICLWQYTNNVIPRILIQCGHTICQECVVKIMKHHVVTCPFCRKRTLVPHGSAAGLPKNFALLGLVQERRGWLPRIK